MVDVTTAKAGVKKLGTGRRTYAAQMASVLSFSRCFIMELKGWYAFYVLSVASRILLWELGGPCETSSPIFGDPGASE